jgi:hypothetical protein
MTTAGRSSEDLIPTDGIKSSENDGRPVSIQL